jgi:hypothetical protein
LNQLSFLNIEKSKPNGQILRDKGIKKAVSHAQDVCGDDWQKKALDFLYFYVLNHQTFSGEMVRLEAKGFVPEPPSLRAWGAIIVSGAKRGWIRQVGFIHVENVKAHRANAALWKSNMCTNNDLDYLPKPKTGRME